jgi:DNA-binding NarL/FixJ family response regulator
MQRNIRVAVFEDHRHLRESIAMVINSSETLSCTGAFPDARQLMKNMIGANPDVVLMDIDMPEINGIEATRIITSQFPNVRVIMLTVFDQNEKIFDAICAGAYGYMLKSAGSEELLEAIRDVFEGGTPMTPVIARKVLGMVRSPARSQASSNHQNLQLTERETEILQLLVDGCAYKTIAERLFISFHTVQTHIRNIYEKLHVNSKSEAVAKAFKDGLI